MVLKRKLSLSEDYTGLGAARLSNVYMQEKQGITKEQFYRFSNTPLQTVTAMMQSWLAKLWWNCNHSPGSCSSISHLPNDDMFGWTVFPLPGLPQQSTKTGRPKRAKFFSQLWRPEVGGPDTSRAVSSKTFLLGLQTQISLGLPSTPVCSNFLFYKETKSHWIKVCLAAAAKSHQSCPILCDPTDGSPPGSAIPGILQARTLEWVAISFSNAWKWKVKEKSLSRVWLFATPWIEAYQAPLSMRFSRQEYWSGLPLPSPKVCPEDLVLI